MRSAIDPSAAKKTANLSINVDLLTQTKSLNINLSATLERALTEIIQDKHRNQWQQDNQELIRQYNQRIEAAGCFSDSLRNFVMVQFMLLGGYL
jgi:antitoxin CcdA